MSGTKKEVEKVPKKKVPRTEKRENGYYLLILYHGLIFYERVPIRRLPGLIWDAEAPFSEASMGKSGAFNVYQILISNHHYHIENFLVSLSEEIVFISVFVLSVPLVKLIRI